MRFIAFDLETTGFLPGVDQIVEIGAVRFVNGKPDAVFSTLINPGRSMPEAASKVSGITDEMLVGQPKVGDILPAFADFCGDELLVAHNAPFDVGFVTADIQKHETPSPRGIILDTLPMARKVLPGLANYRLGTLVEHLKISSDEFHRAEQDSMYCGQIFWKILERIASHGEMPAVENLIALSNNQALRFPQVERKPRQLALF